MSEDAVSLVDIKIASLEEAILKCEVQYQKVKRQCESSAAVTAAAHVDQHPQVCWLILLLAWSAHCRDFQLTRDCRFKCLSCSVSAERKSFFSRRRGSYAMRSFYF
jgi:hypothetical protein